MAAASHGRSGQNSNMAAASHGRSGHVKTEWKYDAEKWRNAWRIDNFVDVIEAAPSNANPGDVFIADVVGKIGSKYYVLANGGSRQRTCTFSRGF